MGPCTLQRPALFIGDGELTDVRHVTKIWDIWRLEGPNFVWHFRGAPHVHAYVNISQKS